MQDLESGESDRDPNGWSHLSAYGKVWNKSLLDRLKRSETASLATKVGLILVGSLAMAVAQFLQDPEGGQNEFKFWLGIFGAVLAFVGGVAVAFSDMGTSDLLRQSSIVLESGRSAVAEREAIEEQIDDLLDVDAKRSNLHNAMRLMVEVIEQAIVQKNTNTRSLIADMLDPSIRQLNGAMGFGGDEGWAVSIFQLQNLNGERVLVRIHELHADRIDEKRISRTWGPYEGFSGLAFSKRAEVIIPDMAADGVYELLNIPKHKSQSTDVARYRSVACVPIRVLTIGASEPWGVVVASSDRVNRFDSDVLRAGAFHVEAIRCVASMIGLAVAALQLPPAAFAQPTPTPAAGPSPTPSVLSSSATHGAA